MNNEQKRVLVTGAAGSIGVHMLAHLFHNTDWHVIGINSFRHKGYIDRLNDLFESHPEWRSRYTNIIHDLNAPLSPVTRAKIGHIHYIINLAALSDVEASIQEPERFIHNNVNVAVNMFEYAREAKPEVFIQVSTDEVYGATTRDSAHKEWDPLVPSNPYSASKACQEVIGIAYWRTYGVPLIITNTMNNFGEMQQGQKYPAMLQNKIEAGETVTVHASGGEIGTRYYLHSRNHADAILYILRNLPPHMHEPNAVDKPDRYNIVGDVQLDNLQLAETIARLMGKELKYTLVDVHSTRPGHDRHYGLSGEKLKTLGWKAPLPFEESLRNTILWQQEHHDWLK